MSTVIVYKQVDGSIAVVSPTAKALKHFTLHQIARKDVPAGLPYYFVDVAELPDTAFQEAYVVADTVLPDGYGYEKQKFEALTTEQAIALMLRKV